MKSRLLVSLLVVLCAVACREPNPLEFQPEVHPERVSIAYLKSLYRSAPVPINNAMQIEGYVVANDFNGNLRNELCVADSTGGIVVRIASDHIYRRYRQGTKVRVRCNGLWLGSAGGVVELGTAPTGEYEVDLIPAKEVGLFVAADSTHQITIAPTPITIAECTPEKVLSLVRVERVQFIEEELPMGWCNTALDSLTNAKYNVPTTRHLIDPQGDTLDVFTLPSADFVRVPLPSGSGSIEGLLGYFNRRYQLRILNSYHIQMTDPRF